MIVSPPGLEILVTGNDSPVNIRLMDDQGRRAINQAKLLADKRFPARLSTTVTLLDSL